MSDDRRNYTPYLFIIIALLGFIAGVLGGIAGNVQQIRDSLPKVEASRDH